MSRTPIRPTDIAELVAAPASHVVAALVLLDYEFTLFALSVVKVALEEFDLLAVAFSLVN